MVRKYIEWRKLFNVPRIIVILQDLITIIRIKRILLLLKILSPSGPTKRSFRCLPSLHFGKHDINIFEVSKLTFSARNDQIIQIIPGESQTCDCDRKRF